MRCATASTDEPASSSRWCPRRRKPSRCHHGVIRPAVANAVRVCSINAPNSTLLGQAGSQPRHCTHVSMKSTNSSSIAAPSFCTPRIASMRPRGEYASSPVTRNVGQCGRHSPHETQADNFSASRSSTSRTLRGNRVDRLSLVGPRRRSLPTGPPDRSDAPAVFADGLPCWDVSKELRQRLDHRLRHPRRRLRRRSVSGVGRSPRAVPDRPFRPMGRLVAADSLRRRGGDRPRRRPLQLPRCRRAHASPTRSAHRHRSTSRCRRSTPIRRCTPGPVDCCCRGSHTRESTSTSSSREISATG